MNNEELMCAETFLEKQEQLFDKPVVETIEEANDFLEDCYAQVFETIEDIRDYFEENGMDAQNMTDEEIEEASEVFLLPDGRYLVVEA